MGHVFKEILIQIIQLIIPEKKKIVLVSFMEWTFYHLTLKAYDFEMDS